MSTPHILSARERDERLNHWLGKKQRPLPEGATETLLNFELPGLIQITIIPPGVTQTINLEEAMSKLECDSYNQGVMMEWEKVFARLALTLRGKLPPYSVLGRIPG